jgi:hypothetical protein
MTQRKPPNKWESWVEEQIRDAQAGGQFENLSGKGKPIPGLTGAHDPMWWVKGLIRRERLSALPDAIEIKVKIERELAQILALHTEAAVRVRIAALNDEIAKLNRTVTAGPATSVAKLDVDAVVERWRRQRTR